MVLFASVFPLLCWLLYVMLASLLETVRPSLSMIMSRHRRRWVENAIHRETPLDAILSGNLMSSVSFFASTTVLIILALFAVLGQVSSVVEAVNIIQPESGIGKADVERHLILVLIMFVLAFLAFTLSLRQFNHFCIMLGAADHSQASDPEEIFVITALNTLGARNFNQGIRAYYFALGMVAWFISPLAAIATTALIFGSILYREFFSSARTLVQNLKIRKLDQKS
ncbi:MULTISPECIES: DUF599 domain-containing protein [Nitratireductor]|jgi:uncharacterized membrane protein|uniref:DUF599 domain-containing protein n=1 Tax=Nitratireductor basaltis TaxID=472175 RepID=A0A084U7W7_9HYPH|nr:DUF599 domain-containing protein [Nitratireductor basaltis]KFB09053.1 hypothetical protein EL18_00067 [Nitratireductor basaltis]